MEGGVTNAGKPPDLENNGGTRELDAAAARDTGTGHSGRSAVEAPVTSTSANVTDSRVVKFEKMEGQATMEGELFEVKLAALLFLRMKNHKDIHSFQLACNVKGAGAMDDLVTRYRRQHETWHTVFTQLKHKKTAKLTVASFTKSKDFSLNKYFESSRDVKKTMTEDGSGVLFDGSFDKCEFVLYTTATVHEKIKNRWSNTNTSDTKTLLNTGSGNELIFTVSKEKDPDVFSSIIGDAEDVNKFLESLTVFSGQAIENQLDEMIQRELLVASNMTKSAVDLIYPYYKEIIKDWWRDSDEILEQDSDIIQRSVNSFQLKNLSLEQEKESCLNLKFQDSFLLDIDTSEDIQVIHVVTNRWLTKVACTKLNQTLQKAEDVYTFLSLDSLLKETDAAMSAWSSGAKHLLVIVSNSTAEHENLCSTLWKHVKNDGTKSSVKKIIVVSQQDDPFTLKLKERFLECCKEIRDDLQLTQLEPDDLAMIKSRELLFQEQLITFDKLIDEETSLFPEVLNDDFIQNILGDDRLSLGPKLEEDISYYIPRTLERFDILSQDVLEANNIKGVFIVRDITVQDLQKLIPKGEKVGKVGNNNSDECRFLVVGSASTEDVNKVFESRENVHEVTMCPDGLLRWKRTKGSIDYINRFVDKKRLTSYNPDTAINLEGRVILVEA